MSNGITQKDLETQTLHINQLTKSPERYSTAIEDDATHVITRTANIGHYHLDYAYGGVKLVRTTNKGGGIRNISNGGYGTKRELYNWMSAFIAGIAV